MLCTQHGVFSLFPQPEHIDLCKGHTLIFGLKKSVTCTHVNMVSIIKSTDVAGAGNFSLHHHIHTGPGAHPASYPMVTRGSFPGRKAAGS